MFVKVFISFPTIVTNACAMGLLVASSSTHPVMSRWDVHTVPIDRIGSMNKILNRIIATIHP